MMLQLVVFDGDCYNFKLVSDNFLVLNEFCVKFVFVDRMFIFILELEIDGEIVD